jgi:transcriptional regulator GlxA family with amidase domain
MKDIVFVLLPQTLLLDLAGPAEAFRLANQRLARLGRPAGYRLRYVAAQPDVATSVGVRLGPLELLPAALPGGARVVLLGQPSGAESALQARVPRAWAETRRWLARVVAPRLGDVELATICAGTLLAADAGLLAGRRCTTHHESLDDLARLAPGATAVGNRVFVVDGPVASSAGITAGIDLALHLIAQDHDDALAAAVARVMVVYLRRGPDDPELSPLLRRRDHLHPAVHRVQDALCAEPSAAWSLARMAEVACVTPRHLARLFRQHAGITPHGYLQDVRVALAERAIGEGRPAKLAISEAGIGGSRQWRRLKQRRRDAPLKVDPASARHRRG